MFCLLGLTDDSDQRLIYCLEKKKTQCGQINRLIVLSNDKTSQVDWSVGLKVESPNCLWKASVLPHKGIKP